MGLSITLSSALTLGFVSSPMGEVSLSACELPNAGLGGYSRGLLLWG